jgi:hypothetical protein
MPAHLNALFLIGSIRWLNGGSSDELGASYELIRRARLACGRKAAILKEVICSRIV